MKKPENNFAFIDGQNLNLGVQKLGWKLDFARFRKYLREKYAVTTAYYFMGYVSENQDLYAFLQKVGYILIFKPNIPDEDGNIKGNIDADLVLQAMIDIDNYDQAIIVSSDGDFCSLVKYLYKKDKLKCVISPYKETCSSLLKKLPEKKSSILITYIRNWDIKMKKHRRCSRRTEPQEVLFPMYSKNRLLLLM